MTTNTPLPKPPQSKEDFEAQKEQPANVRLNPHSGSYSITHRDGKAEVRNMGVQSGTARYFDDSFVEINGMSVKREVYHYMVQSGGLPPDAKIVDYAPHKSEEIVRPFDASAEDLATSSADTDANTDANTKGDPANNHIFDRGNHALEHARKIVGEAVVTSAIEDVAISGELVLPAGLVPQHGERVLAAYTASAREMLSDSGITLEDMSEALEEADLRDARLAVVKGDVGRFREQAMKAAGNLATLPVKAPEVFAAYIDSRFPDLDWKMEQGRALVHVEGKGYIPWDTIVQMGWLSKAKAVAQ